MKQLLLGNVPIFSGLSDRALQVFLQHAKEDVFPAGEIICREGESTDAMFFIEEGQITVMKNYGSPNPLTLATLGQGECFGEMCVLDAQPRSATAKATTQATIVTVSSTAFFRLYQSAPDQYCMVLLNIIRELSRRLRTLGDTFVAKL